MFVTTEQDQKPTPNVARDLAEHQATRDALAVCELALLSGHRKP